MRCTCNRSVVALTSASSTRRTKFRSLDHRCSRHLLYSPEIEYLASARSNAMALSSTTTAARAPLRNSESIWLSESGGHDSMDNGAFGDGASARRDISLCLPLRY